MFREITHSIKCLYDRIREDYSEAQAEKVQDMQECCASHFYGTIMQDMPCQSLKEWYTEEWKEKAKAKIQERKNIKKKVLGTMEQEDKK